MASQRIDMVIGIDVGMSGTAVAYSNLAKARHLDAPVMEFKNWENRDEEGKVPTQLIYDREDIDRGPIAWGFTKQDQPEYPSNHVYAKWFKIDFGHSSPYTIQQHPTRKDLPSADTCYEHFLSRLYSHIEKKLSASELKPMNKTWKDASIEFIFSFPATWDRATVEKLKGLAKKAGFGDHPKHRLTASLSEPEAVAVFSVLEDKIELQNDNTLLVVDAGGGTIDICLSKVKILGENDIRLAELKPNIGEDAGSTYIDSQFQELALEALEILKKAGHELPGGDPLELAWRMMNGEEFQNCKHSCNGLFADDDVFLVGIPGLNGNVSVEEANIMNGELRVKWSQLESMFDEQIKDIAANIEETVMDGKPIDHIILSGGLGSSPYVQKQLQAAFKNFSLIKNARFSVSSKPQLCVCKGLVYERVRRLHNGPSTFTKLCSQDSFGIMKWEKYDSKNKSHKLAKKHNGVRGNRFGEGRMVECIDWLIQKGYETKAGDKFTREFYRRFAPRLKDSNLVGNISVVSSLDEDPPEFCTPDNGVRKIETITCNYSGLKTRPRSWFSLPSRYQEFRFQVEATMEGQEVTFKCLSLDGKLISKMPITVPASNVASESDIPYSMVMSY